MADEKPRFELPIPIPLDAEIVDTQERHWILKEVITSGRFATVYGAADKNKPNDLDYVVKVEYHENAALFAEMNCYQDIAKPGDLSGWVERNNLRYLGLSPFHGFGSYECNGRKYRFLVIERFGKDLQKLFEKNNTIFPIKTVCLIGLSVLDALEYMHSRDYIHGDIKASNLVLGCKNGTENQVYLVDMGLACKFVRDGVHEPELYDPEHRSLSDTPVFACPDIHAHRRCISRKGDLKILAYNLLQWLTGDYSGLFYDRNLSYLHNFLGFLYRWNYSVSEGLSRFLHYINTLPFEAKPDYDHCRKLLKDVLKSISYSRKDYYTLGFEKTKKEFKKSVTVPFADISEPVTNEEVSEGVQRLQ